MRSFFTLLVLKGLKLFCLYGFFKFDATSSGGGGDGVIFWIGGFRIWFAIVLFERIGKCVL